MEFLKQAPLIISTCALLLSAATFWRAGKWKESDGAKELVASISNHKTETAKELAALKTKVAEHEVKLENIATKADIARLESDFRGLEKTIANVDAGVTRIETFLMGQTK